MPWTKSGERTWLKYFKMRKVECKEIDTNPLPEMAVKGFPFPNRRRHYFFNVRISFSCRKNLEVHISLRRQTS